MEVLATGVGGQLGHDMGNEMLFLGVEPLQPLLAHKKDLIKADCRVAV